MPPAKHFAEVKPCRPVFWLRTITAPPSHRLRIRATTGSGIMGPRSQTSFTAARPRWLFTTFPTSQDLTDCGRFKRRAVLQPPVGAGNIARGMGDVKRWRTRTIEREFISEPGRPRPGTVGSDFSDGGPSGSERKSKRSCRTQGSGRAWNGDRKPHFLDTARRSIAVRAAVWLATEKCGSMAG